jgi:hypothetical protein
VFFFYNFKPLFHYIKCMYICVYIFRVASYTLNKNWQTIMCTGGFTKGINSWEIRIDKTTTAGNIFVGVAKQGANLNSYLGKDNIGWGWIGCMTLWHDGTCIHYLNKCISYYYYSYYM